jgi:hypothetical protein
MHVNVDVKDGLWEVLRSGRDVVDAYQYAQRFDMMIMLSTGRWTNGTSI